MVETFIEVWTRREYPVLAEITRQVDEASDGYVSADGVADAAGVTEAGLPHL